MRKLYLHKELQLIFGVTLMAVLGVSSIVPVLPDIMVNLKFSPVKIGLVISMFTLPGVLISPIVGVLADRIGRKVILVPSLFIFGGFGFACFFAQTMEQLLILRFFQGVGAGPLGVLYGTMIGDLYQGRERGQAMGYNASMLAMGTAGFPALGGLLAILGWNYPFLLPLLAIPLGLAIILFLDAPKPQKNGSLKNYFSDAFRMMKTRQVLSLFTITLLTFTILYGPVITYMPLLLRTRFQAPAATIGLVFLVSSGFSGLASFQLGRLTARFGYRTLLSAAAVFYAVAMIFMPLGSSLLMTIPAIMCFGLAQGLNIPTTMTMLTTIAPMEQRGAFMAANGLLLRLAQTTAPLLMAVVYAMFGMNAVFWGGLICAAAILVTTLCCVKNTQLNPAP